MTWERRTVNWIGWSGLGFAMASSVAGLSSEWLPLATPYKRQLGAGMLQLTLLTFAAGFLAAWWSGRGGRATLELSGRTAWLVTGMGTVVYAIGFSALSIFRHRALVTGIWDLGYYAQLAWEFTQLQIPRSSVWHDTPWGNHATFILAATAPFVRLAPDPQTLLVLQSAVLALGAIPACCLGRRLWGSPLAGVVAAGAYLLYPPLQFANLFDFHADAFATPVLLAAFAALFAGRTGWAVLWAGLLALVKEDMALVATTFGLYLALVHARRAGLFLASGGLLAFSLLVWVLIPGWTGSPYLGIFNRWPHLGSTPWELVTSPMLRPAAFFGTVLHPEGLGYILLLLTPLCGLPLLAPEILAVGLPPLASNLLSAVESQFTIRAQYTATLAPVLIAAAIVGGRRAACWLERRGTSPAAVLAAMGAASLIASTAFSPLPWSQDPSARKQFWDATPRHALNAIAAHIPPDASLSAANHLGAHFAMRRVIQIFPQGKETADLVLVDLGGLDYVGAAVRTEAFQPLVRSLIETRPLMAFVDGLALFGRGTPSTDALARLVNLHAEEAVGGGVAGTLTLKAASLAPSRVAPRAYLRARYTWIATARGRGMPCIGEALVPSGGSPVWERKRPLFHSLLPGERWPAGWGADDASVTVVPESIPPGSYTWAVSTWYDGESETCGRVPEGTPRLTVAPVRIDPW